MKRFVLLAHLLLVLGVGYAHAAPFHNGSFETGASVTCGANDGLPAGSTAIPGWTVIVGNIDWAGPCNWIPSDGAHSLDLIGGGTSIGGIEQTFDTIPGETYEVAFELAGNPHTGFPPPVKPLTVTVDGVVHNYSFDTTGWTAPSHMGWETHAFTFVASGSSATISFVSNVGVSTFAGAAIDNVRIVRITGPQPWVGTAGTVLNGSAQPIASSPTVVSDGTVGPAVFTYQTPHDGTCCHSGDWTFETTAPAAATVALNWTYSGYHGTCQAHVGLNAFVDSEGSVQTTPLLNATDTACNFGFPSAGFGVRGQTVLDVAPADSYGFRLFADNFDSNGEVGGRLTVTTGTAPTTTALVSSANPAATGATVNFTATVTGDGATGFMLFTREGRPLPGCDHVPLVGGAAACSTSFLFEGPNNIVAMYTGDSVNAGSTSPTLVQTMMATPPQPQPTLVRVIATTSNEAFVIGRADGALSTAITFAVLSAASCNNGVLVGESPVGGPFTAVTDAEGYFGVPVPNVNAGSFVAVLLTAPGASPVSACAVSSGDNDFWPRALRIVDGATSPRDYIDAAGKARWYKFSVTPGQKITVSLSGLPADFDLAVFKDIGQAFSKQIAPSEPGALTNLSAEFAPSTFSPASYSASAVSPSTFSPDAYAPSTFSPSTFSSTLFAPSTFSPAAVSPSTFSPSTFSPYTLAPSTFSPSTFSPSTAPSTFSPSQILNLDQELVRQAFSSAQTRSLIGVSATPGTGNELVVVNTWNDTGDFYVRVAGRGGAFSTSGDFTLNVAKGPTTCGPVSDPPQALPARAAVAGTNRQAIILTDSTRVAGNAAALLAKLGQLAASVAGVVVDVSTDARVLAYRTQAEAHAHCPYAMNLLAAEIKRIVDAYRAANPSLRHVVIAGPDSAIPFFRYPDESLLGQESAYVPPVRSTSASEASLRNDFVLSQDAYGAKTTISMRGIDFPVPGLAVGRLVETADEIAGVIDAFLANGTVSPTSSLVTGYDFLEDAANAVTTELAAGTGNAPELLITANGISPQDSRSWTATQLGAALLAKRHDVVFLAGHFSANSALAADFLTSFITTELAASTTDFTNSIVFSAGCHAGYNIVDADAIEGATEKLDWPQAFARKRATLIAGTGYQYGDTEFIEYSERLYQYFARQLRAGTPGTSVNVGDALVKAKLEYLATTPEIRGIHQKALLEATVFGLPMLAVNMPAGRDPEPATPGVVAPVLASGLAGSIGLHVAPLTFASSFGGSFLCLRNPPYDTVVGAPPADCPPPNPSYTKAEWLTGPDGVTSNPAEPVLPLHIVNVTPTSNVVLRGVGFVGGSFTESTVVPLTGAPTTELRGVHTPFLSPVFFPMRLATPNYFGAIAGTGGTKLLITPVQHRAADFTAGTSTRRTFTGLELRLFYSNNTTTTALSAAPTIVSVDAAPDSGGVTFTARVVGDPAALVHDVWVTYTHDGAGSGTWSSLALTQCGSPAPAVCGTSTDTQLWMGRLGPQSTTLRYVVQAVNGIGLVSADDNLGAYYSVAAASGGTAPPAPVVASLALNAPPSGATYGETVAVGATLSAGAASVAGKLVSFTVGSASQSGVTDAAGNVTVQLPISALPGTYTLTASFSGDSTLLAASVTQPGFAVGKAPSSLASFAPLGATLNGILGGRPQPIDGAVRFSLTSPQRGATTVWAIADYLGRAILPPPGLAPGDYTVVGAAFDGNATYLPTTQSLAQSINVPKFAQTITFAALPGRMFGDPDFNVAATASSQLPVAFSGSGACTVAGSTVHIAASGTCTITASQPGSLDFDPATPVVQSFAVARGVLIVAATVSPSSFVYGDDVAPSPIAVAYGATYSGTSQGGNLVCLLDPTAAGHSGKPASTPAAAGTYTIVPTLAAGQLSPSCDLVTTPASLVVNQAPSAFAGIAPSLTGQARTSVAISGQLNRPGKPSIYPKAGDLAGAAFDVELRNAGGTVKSYSPVPGDPNGSFTITDTLAPDTYTLDFDYAGGPNFLAAPGATSSLRIVGSESTGNMLQPRVSHTATLLLDGRVLVAGGSGVGDDDRRASRTAEIYCPNPYTPPATPVRTLAQWCPNGLGKFSAAGRGNTAQVGVGNLVQARTYHTATLLPNGTVLLVGGFDGSGASTATAEIYDPSDPVADKFTAVANLPGNAAAGHSATLVTKNNKTYVLVIGGGSAASQLFDTLTKTWTRTGFMSGIRSLHTATRVGNKVFVAGGTDARGRTIQTTTLYDIAAGTFSNGPTLLAPRELHTASEIANGKVLLAGGRMSTGSISNSVALSPLAEIYDPANAATPFAPATFASGTGRYGHSEATLIAANGQPDGRVFVAGGGVNVLCGQQLAATELYAPNAFTAGSNLAAARVRHTATVLKDGRVLVAGGRGATGDRCGPLNTAEIWNGPAGP